MPKPKCAHCGKNPAKRSCPALDRIICPICCGSNRTRTFDCPKTCPFLDHELYQAKVGEEKELNELLHTVPHGQFDDILQDFDTAEIAQRFEAFFADCYKNDLFHLDDHKVKEKLTLLYFVTQKGKTAVLDDFGTRLYDIYRDLLNNGNDDAEVGMVMLRLIISIKAMSGGVFGPCGYLNYLKTQLLPIIAELESETIEVDEDEMELFFPRDRPRLLK